MTFEEIHEKGSAKYPAMWISANEAAANANPNGFAQQNKTEVSKIVLCILDRLYSVHGVKLRKDAPVKGAFMTGAMKDIYRTGQYHTTGVGGSIAVQWFQDTHAGYCLFNRGGKTLSSAVFTTKAGIKGWLRHWLKALNNENQN